MFPDDEVVVEGPGPAEVVEEEGSGEEWEVVEVPEVVVGREGTGRV